MVAMCNEESNTAIFISFCYLYAFEQTLKPVSPWTCALHLLANTYIAMTEVL